MGSSVSSSLSGSDRPSTSRRARATNKRPTVRRVPANLYGLIYAGIALCDAIHEINPRGSKRARSLLLQIVDGLDRSETGKRIGYLRGVKAVRS